MTISPHHLLASLAVGIVIGIFVGWNIKPPDDPVFDDGPLQLERLKNAQLRDRRAFDSTYTARLEHAYDSAVASHNIPVKERVAHAQKALHSASLDSLQRILLRPIPEPPRPEVEAGER